MKKLSALTAIWSARTTEKLPSALGMLPCTTTSRKRAKSGNACLRNGAGKSNSTEGQKNMKIKTLDRNAIEAMTGYRPFTTFFEDFSIAEAFGADAVRETDGRTFEEWKSNYKYLTELVMVLNWKIWEHYQNNDDLVNIYNELWAKADGWACDNLKGEELSYFYRTTD